MTVAIGIDGCKDGWFFFRFEDGVGTFGVAANIGEMLDDEPPDGRALIDIPIGLKERGKTERDCDLLARDYAAAAAAFERVPGAVPPGAEAAPTTRRRRRRTWQDHRPIFVAPDLGHRAEDSRGRRLHLRASQPAPIADVPVRGPSGGRVLRPRRWADESANKKTRDGFTERMTILQIFEPDAQTYIASAFLAHGGFEATRDDIVDAYALALCAKHPGRWRTAGRARRILAKG